MLQLMQLSDAIAQLSEAHDSNDSSVVFGARATGRQPHSRCSTLALSRVSSRRNSGTLGTIREESSNHYDVEPGYYLHAAIIAGNISSISYLLTNGSDPNNVRHGFTPLTLCLSLHKQLQTTLCVTKQLVEHGANVNLMSPLHIACRKGLIPIIEILLANGASTEMLESSTGFTVLQLTLILLINSNSDSQIELYMKVSLAVLHNSRVDVTNCGLEGTSPLQLSILSNQPEIILAVLSNEGSNFSQQDILQAFQLMDSCSFTAQTDYQDIISRLEMLKITSLERLSSNTKDQHVDNELETPNTTKLDDCKDNLRAKGHTSDSQVVHSVIPKTTMKQQAEFLLNFLQ